MIKRRLPLSLFILLLINLAVIGCADSGPSQGGDLTLQSLDGSNAALSSYTGRSSVLLVFGATWCPHCVNEIPELKEVHGKYGGRGLEVLYIDIQESAKKVAAFVEKHSIPYTVLLDLKGAAARRYGVRGIPHTVLIGKDGEILYDGPRPSSGLMVLIEERLGIHKKGEER